MEFRPRFLGRSTSRAQHDAWIAEVPFPYDAEMSLFEDDRGLEAFRLKLELADSISKNKSKAAKSAKKAEVMVRRQEMTKQVLRAQRYLGLAAENNHTSTGQSKLTATLLDISQPSPHPFASEPIIIAIDVESWERNHNAVTEVGVATLDTRDLQGHAPGRVGEDWQKHIRARHFRVIENKDYINKDFIDGCPGAFQFGDSEFVGLKSMASVLTSCFHEPFSKKAADDGSWPDVEEDANAEKTTEKRNIILLGHDVGNDISYCHKLGFSVTNRGNLLEILDTAAMYRAYTRDPNPKSLGKILLGFDLDGWHLHNAGNDAVYTLWAFLAIAVSDAAESNKDERHQEAAEKRVEAAVEQAKERVKDDSEGWDVEEGGVALATHAGTNGSDEREVYGPPRPSANGLYTMGGAPLDV